MSKRKNGIIALDTETTGLDLYHGAQPFLITFATEEGENIWYEWDVDPLTRKPLIVYDDLIEIQYMIDGADRIALQNPKFDVGALGVTFQGKLDWDWSKVDDCLFAGHLLASNQPHDLTTMVLVYLGINVKPFEDKIKSATEKARRICRTNAFIEAHGEWAIAKKGRSDMPSAKEKVWKNDMWLPRAICKHAPLFLPTEKDFYVPDHPWQTVCSEYANSDSTTTLMLRNRQMELLKERGLEAIYRKRLELLPIIHKMEDRGITLSKDRLSELVAEYTEEAEIAHNKCVTLSDNTIDKLPVNGRSNALNEVVFGTFKLESPKKTESGAPSMDKDVLTHWMEELAPSSKAYHFIKNLGDYRKRKTAVAYMEGYERFWLPVSSVDPVTGAGWYVLHPSLNPTGTDTLRWSSSNPNEQNISRKEGFNLRYCFGPAPGREWWSCDAKNIELRIPAYESGETEMIDLFEREDEEPYYGSVHCLMFHTIYPKEFEACDGNVKEHEPVKYGWVKNGDFAVQYGSVEQSGTADRAYHKQGAFSKIKGRFKAIHGPGGLNDQMIEFAKEHGYVETMPDKTVDPNRGYPLLCSRNRWGSIKPTVPLNYHVQGTAMWWMMSAMIRCQEYLDTLPDHYMVMQVHDEIVFDFPKGENKLIIRKIQRLMAQGGDDIGVPTPVSATHHEHNWSEGVDL